MSELCMVRRRDTAAYDYGSATYAPDPAIWAPSCGHADCVADDESEKCRNGHWWGCAVAACRHAALQTECDLEDGHAGEHRFDGEGHVVPLELIFPAAPVADGQGAGRS